MPIATDPRARLRKQLDSARSGGKAFQATPGKPDAVPIVVAVDNSRAAAAAAQVAVRLARDLAAPLVFVYVRRVPSSALGELYYQRRLDAELASGRRALADPLAVAEEVGVPATGEQLAGNPARRVVEFARLRAARIDPSSLPAARRRPPRRTAKPRIGTQGTMGVRSGPDRCSYP
jgi:hypothetical protein